MPENRWTRRNDTRKYGTPPGHIGAPEKYVALSYYREATI
jgi:hypothetical protein